MENVQNWLEAELRETVDALTSTPPADRKGPVITAHRQRARDLTVALQLVKEFELLHRSTSVDAAHVVTPTPSSNECAPSLVTAWHTTGGKHIDQLDA